MLKAFPINLFLFECWWCTKWKTLTLYYTNTITLYFPAWCIMHHMHVTNMQLFKILKSLRTCRTPWTRRQTIARQPTRLHFWTVERKTEYLKKTMHAEREHANSLEKGEEKICVCKLGSFLAQQVTSQLQVSWFDPVWAVCFGFLKFYQYMCGCPTNSQTHSSK